MSQPDELVQVVAVPGEMTRNLPVGEGNTPSLLLRHAGLTKERRELAAVRVALDHRLFPLRDPHSNDVRALLVRGFARSSRGTGRLLPAAFAHHGTRRLTASW